LIGRERELSLLREFFQQSAVSGGALVLSGEPGVGKTALINALADALSASGTMVLRAAGSQFEQEISFAGLNQALLPLLDLLDELGDVHRDALRVALGLGSGSAPGQLLVSNAVLALLRRAAARVPVVLIVDDLPSIDRASAGALSFAARRLVGSRAGLLVTLRVGAQSYFDGAGLLEYELKPLADEASAQLVSSRFPGLDPWVMTRVLNTAQGNPLALLELPEALSHAQRSAMEALPSVLPLGQRLHELFTSRIAQLPPETRMLLLMAALEGAVEASVLEAAGGGDYQLGDLAPAERDHLVRADESSRLIVFRHPLARSAAVEAAPQPPAVLALQMDTYIHPVRTGVAALPRLDAALRAVQRETDPHVIENVAACATYADRLGELREPLWRMVQRGRAGGPARKQLTALANLCFDDFVRGDWGEAQELAAEGLKVAEERVGRFFGWYFRYVQALLAAVQGRFDTSRALANQVIGWAGPRGVGLAQVWAHYALELADLGAGDFEGAYRHATAMSPAGTLAPYAPHCLWAVMDLVESAVRTHRHAEAQRHVHAMREAGVAALSPRLAILVAGSAALVADDDQAPALFEEALSVPTVDQWPFDVARVRLAYGERLRRTRATIESRVPLDMALTTFQKLGAVPWATRAELELRATGQARTPSSAMGAVALTPQELQIARLAASGMTNN